MTEAVHLSTFADLTLMYRARAEHVDLYLSLQDGQRRLNGPVHWVTVADRFVTLLAADTAVTEWIDKIDKDPATIYKAMVAYMVLFPHDNVITNGETLDNLAADYDKACRALSE